MTWASKKFCNINEALFDGFGCFCQGPDRLFEVYLRSEFIVKSHKVLVIWKIIETHFKKLIHKEKACQIVDGRLQSCLRNLSTCISKIIIVFALQWDNLIISCITYYGTQNNWIYLFVLVGCPRDVIVKAMYYGIVISEFVLWRSVSGKFLLL